MAPVLDLAFLAQSGVRAAPAARRSGLRGLLEDVAWAPTARSAAALGGGGRRQAREALGVYSLDVMPPA